MALAFEIKKALAMCYKQGLTSECDGCPYREHNGVCMDALMEDALDLIIKLQDAICGMVAERKDNDST